MSMATQLQFSRHSYTKRSSEDASAASPFQKWREHSRHVAFAVQDAVPSPQLYHRHDPDQNNEYGNPGDAAADSIQRSDWQTAMQQNRHAVQPLRMVPPPSPRKAMHKSGKGKADALRKKTKPRATTTTIAAHSRKPGWDTDVRAPAAVFDITLKKSALFQPRAGDRQREIHREDESLHPTPNTLPRPVKPRPISSSTSAWNARIASSIPGSQPAPRRKTKDYVKMNMEKITGQRYETLVHRTHGNAPMRQRGSVFERLATPVLHKSVPRFRSPSPTRSTTNHNEEPKLASPPKLTIASPVTAPIHRYQEKRLSPRRDRSLGTARSSPSRERVRSSSSSPRSVTHLSTPNSRVSSPGFPRSDDRRYAEPQRQQPSMAAQVFEVLDRQHCGRISVNQILDGLRLLHLPATQNQVSDYVYLIHEGAINTIDLDEWLILVGTLDAATQPVASPESPPPSIKSRVSPSPGREASSARSRSSLRNSPPRSVHPRQSSPPRASPELMLSSPDHDYELESHDEAHWSGRRAAMASSEPQEDPEDWYMQAIQRRVDEMYERAEQVVAQRQGSRGSSQLLEQAASAVYHLKSSLYPLVEQAETILKDVRHHESAKLSARLRPSDLARIAGRSEDIANLLFNDLLLDTVEELNKEDRVSSQKALHDTHAETLDQILLQIQQLEAAENDLIQNQFAMGFQKDNEVAIKYAPASSRERKAMTHEGFEVAPQWRELPADKVVLPLGVVLGLGIDDVACSIGATNNDLHEVTDPTPTSTNWEATNELRDEEESVLGFSTLPMASMAVLSGQRFQQIEKNRVRFSKHRQLVESSLEATGMDQATVIEMLTDLLLDEITTECALELESGVEALTDTLAETLV